MCTRWSSSICLLFVWTCLSACKGSIPGNNNENAGSPAAGDGGDGAQDPDSGSAYEGDAGDPVDDAGASDAANGGVGGAAGGGRAGSGGKGGSASTTDLSDVAPAECRPDPTDFTPCGGDIRGKWRVASLCFDEGLEDLREQLACPELTQEFSSDYRLLVDYKGSSNYTAALDAEAVQRIRLPFSCVPEEVDCKALLGDDDADDSDGRTLFVTMSDEACLIEVREHRAITEAGSWEVSGSELTMTNSTGPNTSEYCVTGNTLIAKNVNEVTGEVSWGVFERP